MSRKTQSLAKRILFMIYYYISLVIVPIVYNKAHKSGELRHLSEEDFVIWKKSMLRMLKEFCAASYNFRIRQVIYTFALSKVQIIRKQELPSKEAPIVVLCIKNDLKRIKMLVEHYRNLGVERFAFMDNGSDDGTYEWLLEQPDIDLYRCFEQYQTLVKEGWINRIVSHYGFDRWYILTDSDELIVYTGMEDHPLKDVLVYARRNKIRRMQGLTIDMYAAGSPFGNTEDIRGEYKWMDVDTYFAKETLAGKQEYTCLLGGPRYRLMNSYINLSKYPLVYFAKGTISDSAHFQYPHKLLPVSPCCLGILHYKFIDKDLEEYKKRAQGKSGFSSGGRIYKEYMDYVEANGEASFMYEGSVEYKDSRVLENISLIERMKF